MGLSIVRRLVERHGGRIWFESTAGGGTTFYVTLPAQRPGDLRG
jgi:signal transduction histidine kinase